MLTCILGSSLAVGVLTCILGLSLAVGVLTCMLGLGLTVGALHQIDFCWGLDLYFVFRSHC